MTARAEHPMQTLRHPWSREVAVRVTAVPFCVAAGLVAAIGVLSLLPASSLRRMVESWIDIHALFGLLLGGLVYARYRWSVGHQHRTKAPPAEAQELSRRLSRIVYLMLYAVVGIRQSIVIVNHLWHGDAMPFTPKQDFQTLLAAGLLVLLVVRLLACRVEKRRMIGVARCATSLKPGG
jgi:hypothetical protein